MCRLLKKLCPLTRAQSQLSVIRREVVLRSASRRINRQRAYFFFEAFFFAFFLVAMMDISMSG
jgi:hypothetical protein